MIARTGLAPVILILVAGLVPIGCGSPGVDTTYGRSRGPSINGSGVLAELIRQGGGQVRAAVRLNETLGDWADVLVRFSPHPGPPDAAEGQWLQGWLRGRPGRRLVYVVRDFDAEPEFWEAMIAAQTKAAAPAETIERLKKDRAEAASWPSRLPARSTNPASARDWFAMDPKPAPAGDCKSLEGPWAVGVDVRAAAIYRHEGFRADDSGELVLLRGDGSPLAIAWTIDNGSRVLALANPSFLLNAALLNPARRPMALDVVEWLGPEEARVAFVEGDALMAKDDPDGSPSTSPFHLFRVDPFGRVAAHVLVFLLILALAHAVRLGRALPESPAGFDRPSAHPEALGALLARTRAPPRRRPSPPRNLSAMATSFPLRPGPDGHPRIRDQPTPEPPRMNEPEIEFLDDSTDHPEAPRADPPPPPPAAAPGPVAEWASRVLGQVNKVYVGQDDLVRGVLAALLADGHVLIESVPGLGKTLLVRALGRVLGCGFNRIQFTPDLMPSDVTGSPVYDERQHDFRFRPGPVFTQLLLADEINRAPAKTHSALPGDHAGVPSDRRRDLAPDRAPVPGPGHPEPHRVRRDLQPPPRPSSTASCSSSWPNTRAPGKKTAILRLHTQGSSPDALLANDLETVTGPEEVLAMQASCGSVLVDDRVLEYIATLVRKTRDWPTFSLGASPRAGVAILRGARAVAALEGRTFAVPDDVQEVAPWALRHRVILTPEAEVEGQGADDLLADLIRSVEVPRS